MPTTHGIFDQDLELDADTLPRRAEPRAEDRDVCGYDLSEALAGQRDERW